MAEFFGKLTKGIKTLVTVHDGNEFQNQLESPESLTDFDLREIDVELTSEERHL